MEASGCGAQGNDVAMRLNRRIKVGADGPDKGFWLADSKAVVQLPGGFFLVVLFAMPARDWIVRTAKPRRCGYGCARWVF